MADEMRTITEKGYKKAQDLIDTLELFDTNPLGARYQLELAKIDLKFFESIINLLDQNPNYDYIPKAAFRNMMAGKMHEASYMVFQARRKDSGIPKDLETEAANWASYYKTLWSMFDFGPYFSSYDQ